jgi:hypothetical protein
MSTAIPVGTRVTLGTSRMTRRLNLVTQHTETGLTHLTGQKQNRERRRRRPTHLRSPSRPIPVSVSIPGFCSVWCVAWERWRGLVVGLGGWVKLWVDDDVDDDADDPMIGTSKWDAAPLAATATAKTSRTQSRGTTAVSPTQRCVSHPHQISTLHSL